MVKMYDGFSCLTIGSITLPIEVATKFLDVTFLSFLHQINFV